ncbi:hypothetical protein GCM10028778_12590 [Barrientosiimonas marina]
METATLDKYGNVHVDRERLPVPKGMAQQSVTLKIYWDSLEVMDETYTTLAVLPRPNSLKQQKINWTQELEQIQNKPRAVPYTMVYSALPEVLQRYLSIDDLVYRKRRLKCLIQWLGKDYQIDQIAEAITHIAPHLWDEEGVVYQELYRTIHPEKPSPFDRLEESYTPSGVRNYEPVLEAYDVLTGEVWS